jgi:hypothetical protein
LDFNNIVSGELGSSRDLYYDALNNLAISKPSLYIVDIPDRATSADLIAETNLYRAKFGHYPKIVILDYANEMDPVTPWKQTSDKMKNLGVELRRICRSHRFGMITSMQENREGVKLKDKEKSGLENIGESHYFSNVCHVVVHLHQDEADQVENILRWSIKKNRYGKKNVSFTTYANAVYNYVGDRQIHVRSNADVIETTNEAVEGTAEACAAVEEGSSAGGAEVSPEEYVGASAEETASQE